VLLIQALGGGWSVSDLPAGNSIAGNEGKR